jgi:GDPmannose 4,6-dehydratase
MKRVFITGTEGQDGSYLAELLLEKNYEVHGLVHRLNGPRPPNLEHLIRDGRICQKRRHLYPADLDDADSVRGPLEQAAPDEIYHLAGQSHVGQSFEKVEETCRVTAFGTLRLLELVRWLTRPPRFFHGQFQ